MIFRLVIITYIHVDLLSFFYSYIIIVTIVVITQITIHIYHLAASTYVDSRGNIA